MIDSAATSRSAGLLTSRLLDSKAPQQRAPEDYRQLIKDIYDGPAGWFTLVTGVFTGHEILADNILSPEAFDISGCKRILDVGCGNGRYLRFLLRQADADAQLTGCDLSAGMLRRARTRLKSDRPFLLTADLTRLPFGDDSFDAIICGWVFEHLQDPLAGLTELARVTAPGGKILLMTTESTLLGSCSSWLYRCRTTRRIDLQTLCQRCGLEWHRELWWSKFHKLFRLGGIVVELRRPDTD